MDDVADFAHAAKQTYYGKELRPVQQAWLWRVRQMAEGMTLRHSYREQALRDRLVVLRELAADSERIREIPKILGEAGVRFLIVEGLPGARVDGVTLWLNARSPVIALTLRFDRLDNFWFVLRHEIEHVLRRHGQERSKPMVDIELGPGAAAPPAKLPKEEQVANAAAAEFCLPQATFDAFLRGLVAAFSEKKVEDFAAQLSVHPSVVVGQIQRRLERYDILRKYLAKVRHIITAAATTDGFGHVHQFSST